MNDGKLEGKQDTSQSLLEETGLPYIPMYSTEVRSRESPDLKDEPPRLERLLSKGDLSRTLTPLRKKTAIEDILKIPPCPSISARSCGRVRTSFKYLEQVKEKESMQVEAKKDKEKEIVKGEKGYNKKTEGKYKCYYW